jgi:hypothetical protein
MRHTHRWNLTGTNQSHTIQKRAKKDPNLALLDTRNDTRLDTRICQFHTGKTVTMMKFSNCLQGIFCIHLLSVLFTIPKSHKTQNYKMAEVIAVAYSLKPYLFTSQISTL